VLINNGKRVLVVEKHSTLTHNLVVKKYLNIYVLDLKETGFCEFILDLQSEVAGSYIVYTMRQPCNYRPM
jgi:hypothetical protein